MAGIKPKKADGYSAEMTVACESTLLTLLGAFGTLKHTLRLVGGLVPRYLTPETPPEVSQKFATRALSGRHRDAVNAGLAALRKRFCDDENTDGYLKVGPVCYARFHATGDDDESIQSQRDAAARVQAFVQRVEAVIEAGE